MESTVNRKDYRRNYKPKDELNLSKTKKEEKRTYGKIFLSKIINTMLLILFVLLLKFFGFNDEYNSIKEAMSSGVPFEEIKEYAISNFNKTNYSGDFVLEEVAEIKPSGEDAIIENNSGDYVEESYITAVEGVNQMLEDTEYIKNNYTIKAPLVGTVTSAFGNRTSDNPQIGAYHTGLDIAANQGSIIYAAHSGEVVKAEKSGSYGNVVVIKDGDLTTVYAHCLDILVKKGEKVKLGQKIARVGMTGNATGPHLHFEVRFKDMFLNPEDFIK